MPLVSAKCTNCGGTLEVDDSKEAAVCPLCGTPYIVEKAVNNYNNVTHHHTVNNITADVVNVAKESEFVIEKGVVTAYKGLNSDIVIPEGVVEIGENAFEGTAIESLSLPSSLLRIGDFAFNECRKLKSIDLPEGLEVLGQDAFSETPLKSVRFPESLRYIDAEAFFGCKNLESIELPEGLKGIGSQAFSETPLKSIRIPKSMQELGNEALASCTNLKSVELPEGLKKIGREAFRYCESLESVELPEGLEEIDDRAFLVLLSKALHYLQN